MVDKRIVTSKRTTLTIMTLILASVVVSSYVPQRIATPTAAMESWRGAHPILLPLVDALGLHHLYATPWFALLVFLALVSLSTSCVQQLRIAWRTTFCVTKGGEIGVLVATDASRIASALTARGYLRIGAACNVIRCVKHPWGYWGNALLHVGMIVSVASSLFIALTQQRGAVFLQEGELFPPGARWQAEEHGAMARVLTLPMTVSLDRLRVSFMPDQHIDRAASDLTFIDGSGLAEHHTVGINDVLSYGDLTIYQRSDYGDLFRVSFTDEQGITHVESLPIGFPSSPAEAGYCDFRFPWLPYLISTKYYTDVARKSLGSPDRQLYLRLLDKEKREVARVSLQKGERAQLGRYSVQLLAVGRWSGLIFVRNSGMPFVFAGFFIIVLGGALTYMTPPREFIASPGSGGYYVRWWAVRFSDFYRNEGEELMSALQGENPDG